jgi:hypothetical protein
LRHCSERTRADTNGGSAWQQAVRNLAKFYPGLNAYSTLDQIERWISNHIKPKRKA